ncbi:MAG TPA: isoprenylcysteine carboxylmethyltransferase family protein [Terriglobia bacterium]|nr:isoprenylcysteine carboxylmethyltransferase family protein [Terriglobia bacterium]
MHSLSRVLDALAFVYALLFFPAPFFWIVIHSFIDFWRRFGNRALWVALPLWTANAAALGLLAHRVYAGRLPRNALTVAIGAALVVAGLGIGHHVHRVFGLRRLGGLPEVNPARYPGGVVRSGLFARLRHPRYVEYMISFAGWALLTGAPGNYVLAMATVLMYLIVAPLEERELRRHYGEEYGAYARAVPRFIPRLWRPAETRSGGAA